VSYLTSAPVAHGHPVAIGQEDAMLRSYATVLVMTFALIGLWATLTQIIA